MKEYNMAIGFQEPPEITVIEEKSILINDGANILILRPGFRNSEHEWTLHFGDNPQILQAGPIYVCIREIYHRILDSRMQHAELIEKTNKMTLEELLAFH
jgi:hypothetical protein